MQAVSPVQLNLDTCLILSRVGRPFIIKHGKGNTPFFLAFPCVFEDGEPTQKSISRITEYLKTLIVEEVTE